MGIPQGIFGAGQQPGWKRRIGRGRELCTVVQQNAGKPLGADRLSRAGSGNHLSGGRCGWQADWNDRHPPPAQRRTPALWRQHRVQRAPLLPQTGLCHTDARTGSGGVPQNADAEGAGHLQQGEHRLGKDHPEKRRCFRKRGGRKRERRGPHHPALLDYPVIRREKTGLRPFGSSPVFFTCADACAAPARCPDRRTSQDRQDR